MYATCSVGSWAEISVTLKFPQVSGTECPDKSVASTCVVCLVSAYIYWAWTTSIGLHCFLAISLICTFPFKLIATPSRFYCPYLSG